MGRRSPFQQDFPLSIAVQMWNGRKAVCTAWCPDKQAGAFRGANERARSPLLIDAVSGHGANCAKPTTLAPPATRRSFLFWRSSAGK